MVASPAESFQKLKRKIKPEWKTAFLGALVIGLLIHMPVMLSDIPNHDGLDSMYFDQNMITSGRWFLTIACGFSSYYTLPWVIGLLGLLFLAAAAAALTELLELKGTVPILLVSGLLVSYQKVSFRFCMGRGLSCIQYGNISGISFCRHAPVYLLHSGNLHGTKQLEA